MARAGKPGDIAATAAFIAADLPAFKTGTIITIDGGAADRGPNF